MARRSHQGKLILTIVYRLIANHGWRSQLKKQGATAPLDARPFV